MANVSKYKEFFEDSPKNNKYHGSSGAGALIISKDTGRILLILRSSDVGEPNTWGVVGGKVDAGESPNEAVTREVEEETGYDGVTKISPLYVYKDGDFKYHNYLIIVPFEFTPQLNWENDNSAWVEYGDWPTPLHFGVQELLKNSGHKIKNVVDLLKKRVNITEMEAPPAIVQPESSLSKDFINYIKSVENANRLGFKGGKWYPHASPEGGMPTIGYGHKIQDKYELKRFRDGVVDSTVERMLASDLALAKKKVYVDVKNMFGIYIPLDQKQEEILTDYVFNLGTLKGFPKFVKAVLNKDWKTASKEYKRSYDGKELSRNKVFFDKFLRTEEASKNPESSDIKVVPQGLVGVGIHGYKWITPHSFLSFGHDPSSRLFYFYMIQTPNEEDRNQGYSKNLLEKFFQMIKQKGGVVDVESYTTSGMAFVKHVMERLAKKYNVNLV